MTKILDEKNELAATPESNDPVEGLAQSYLEKSPSDVFSDLSQLRFPQNFEPVGVTPVLMAVPVRKTNKTKFARLHPDDWVEAFTLETADQQPGDKVPTLAASPSGHRITWFWHNDSDFTARPISADQRWRRSRQRVRR